MQMKKLTNKQIQEAKDILTKAGYMLPLWHIIDVNYPSTKD